MAFIICFRLYEAVRENILHLFCESVLCETAAALQEKPQSILQKPAY